jgi:hypothetical protein
VPVSRDRWLNVASSNVGIDVHGKSNCQCGPRNHSIDKKPSKASQSRRNTRIASFACVANACHIKVKYDYTYLTQDAQYCEYYQDDFKGATSTATEKGRLLQSLNSFEVIFADKNESHNCENNVARQRKDSSHHQYQSFCLERVGLLGRILRHQVLMHIFIF